MANSSDASRDIGLGSLLARFVPAWRERGDSEHEQAVVRFLIGIPAILYLFAINFRDGVAGWQEWVTIFFAATFLSAAAGIVISILLDPGVSPLRRHVGMVLDVAAPTAALHLNGYHAAPLFLIYLWVAFDHGFRYGRGYMRRTVFLCVLGFLTVLWVHRDWHASPYLSAALLVCLVGLPAYLAALLKGLTAALESEKAANEAKSRFLATMSHEIRTPLHGIVGINELLLHTDLGERQRRYAKLVQQSSQWLMHALNDVLDFSKAEAGEFTLEKIPFDPAEVVREVVFFHAESHSSAVRTIGCTLDPHLPKTVAGDPTRLAQVLNNLLSNAVKFTDRGSITVAVRRVAGRGAGSVGLSFSVADTGVGIPSEKQQEIFDAFRQARPSDASTIHGTGLGLAIASRIVALMGGKLEVESMPGFGSTFLFTLHLPEAVAAASVRQEGLSSLVALRWKRPPSVLLVEDNAANQEVGKALLERLGCEAVVAADGRLALEAFGTRPFDIVLMDCQMPEMDGYDATLRIREGERGKDPPVRVPIVALTAHVTAADRDKCLALGMDDYLGKPFRAASLAEKLALWLPSLCLDSHCRPASPPRAATVADTAVPAVTLFLPSEEIRSNLHELNNHLATILCHAELAGDVPLTPEEQRESLRSILSAANRACAIASALARRNREAHGNADGERMVG